MFETPKKRPAPRLPRAYRKAILQLDAALAKNCPDDFSERIDIIGKKLFGDLWDFRPPFDPESAKSSSSSCSSSSSIHGDIPPASDAQKQKDTVGTRSSASETSNSEKAPELKPDVNHPTVSPSPWGEGRGEGEQNNTKNRPPN